MNDRHQPGIYTANIERRDAIYAARTASPLLPWLTNEVRMEDFIGALAAHRWESAKSSPISIRRVQPRRPVRPEDDSGSFVPPDK